jgi:hypothetical protein
MMVMMMMIVVVVAAAVMMTMLVAPVGLVMMIKHGQVRNDRNTQEPNALETFASWEAPAPIQKVFHLHLYDRRTDNV